MCALVYVVFFFFKQKTAYEMRISDWSSDVCSSDLLVGALLGHRADRLPGEQHRQQEDAEHREERRLMLPRYRGAGAHDLRPRRLAQRDPPGTVGAQRLFRSEEHTSELQSLMRISYAVFCLKKKIHTIIAPPNVL